MFREMKMKAQQKREDKASLNSVKKEVRKQVWEECRFNKASITPLESPSKNKILELIKHYLFNGLESRLGFS